MGHGAPRNGFTPYRVTALKTLGETRVSIGCGAYAIVSGAGCGIGPKELAGVTFPRARAANSLEVPCVSEVAEFIGEVKG